MSALLLFSLLFQAPSGQATKPATTQPAATQPAATAPADDEAKKEMEALKGTWKFTKLEAGGQPSIAGAMDISRLVFGDGTITMTTVKGEMNETAKFKLNVKEKPKQLDIIAVRKQPDGAEKEQAAPGIYELNGDTLKICFAKDGARPSAFASKAGDPAVLMELKREKK